MDSWRLTFTATNPVFHNKIMSLSIGTYTPTQMFNDAISIYNELPYELTTSQREFIYIGIMVIIAVFLVHTYSQILQMCGSFGSFVERTKLNMHDPEFITLIFFWCLAVTFAIMTVLDTGPLSVLIHLSRYLIPITYVLIVFTISVLCCMFSRTFPERALVSSCALSIPYFRYIVLLMQVCDVGFKHLCPEFRLKVVMAINEWFVYSRAVPIVKARIKTYNLRFQCVYHFVTQESYQSKMVALGGLIMDCCSDKVSRLFVSVATCQGPFDSNEPDNPRTISSYTKTFHHFKTFANSQFIENMIRGLSILGLDKIHGAASFSKEWLDKLLVAISETMSKRAKDCDSHAEFCLVFCLQMFTSVYDAVITGDITYLYQRDEDLADIHEEFSTLHACAKYVLSGNIAAIPPAYKLTSTPEFVSRCTSLLGTVTKVMKRNKHFEMTLKNMELKREKLMGWLTAVHKKNKEAGLITKGMTVVICGRSHLGKSNATDEILDVFAAVRDVPRTPTDTWICPMQDEYDTGFSSDMDYMIMDDAKNSKEDKSFMEKLIRCINNRQSMSVQADVDDKGMHPFSLKGAVVTTNVSPETLVEDSNSAVSGYNRFGICCEVDCLEAYRSTEGKPNWSLIEEEFKYDAGYLKVRVLESEYLRGESFDSESQANHWGPWMNWYEFKELVGTKYRQHVNRQELFVEKCQMKRKLRLCKHFRYAISCPECDDVSQCYYCGCQCKTDTTIQCVSTTDLPKMSILSKLVADYKEQTEAIKLAKQVEGLRDEIEKLRGVTSPSSVRSPTQQMPAEIVALGSGLVQNHIMTFLISVMVNFAMFTTFTYAFWRYAKRNAIAISKIFSPPVTGDPALIDPVKTREKERFTANGVFNLMWVGLVCVTIIRAISYLFGSSPKATDPKQSMPMGVEPVATEEESFKMERLPSSWRSFSSFNPFGESEASKTARFSQVVNSVANNNMCRIELYDDNNNLTSYTIGLGIVGNDIAVVGHFKNYVRGPTSAKIVRITTDSHMYNKIVDTTVIRPEQISKVYSLNGQHADICLLRVDGVNPFRNIQKHLRNGSPTAVCSSSGICLRADAKAILNPVPDYVNKQSLSNAVTGYNESASKDPSCSKARNNGPVVGVSDIHNYEDKCGSVFIGRQSTSIEGILCATSELDKKIVFATLTKEMYVTMSNELTQFRAACPIPFTESIKFWNATSMLFPKGKKITPTPVHEKHAVRSVEGDVSMHVLGADRERGFRMKSRVKEFKFAHQLAELLGLDRNYGKPPGMKYYSAFNDNLNRMVRPMGLFNAELFAQAECSLDGMYNAGIETCHYNLQEHSKVLPFDTAISGADGISCYKGANPNSSPGLVIGGVKKDHLQYREVTDKPYTIHRDASQPLRKTVKGLYEVYKKGEMGMCPVDAKMKDEVTALTKVVEGDEVPNLKVRPYYVTLWALDILARMLIQPLLRAMYMAPGLETFEHLHGLDAGSYQWGDMRAYHDTIPGDNFIAGDFSKWDQSHGALIAAMYFRFLLRSAECSGNYNEESLDVMKGIFTDLMFPLINYNGVFMMFSNLMCSGNLLTVEINNHAVRFLMRYAYFHAAKAAGIENPPEFRQVVRLCVGGDDHVAKVSSSIPWYNMISVSKAMASIGLKYTDTSKSAPTTPYISRETVDFYSRTWRPASWDSQILVGPLKRASLSKMVLCYLPNRDSPPEEQVLAASLESYIRELVLHDHVEAGAHRDKIITFMEENDMGDLAQTIPTIEEIIENYNQRQERFSGYVQQMPLTLNPEAAPFTPMLSSVYFEESMAKARVVCKKIREQADAIARITNHEVNQQTALVREQCSVRTRPTRFKPRKKTQIVSKQSGHEVCKYMPDQEKDYINRYYTSEMLIPPPGGIIPRELFKRRYRADDPRLAPDGDPIDGYCYSNFALTDHVGDILREELGPYPTVNDFLTSPAVLKWWLAGLFRLEHHLSWSPDRKRFHIDYTNKPNCKLQFNYGRLEFVVDGKPVRFLDDARIGGDVTQIETTLDEVSGQQSLFEEAGRINTSIDEFLSRRTLVDRGVFSTQRISKTIYPYEILLNQPHVRRKISNYRYFRGDLVLDIVTTGNPLVAGRFGFAWRPYLATAVDDSVGTDFELMGPGGIPLAERKTHMLFDHLQRVYADPSRNESQELRIPFMWHDDYITIQSSEAKMLGALHIYDLVSYMSGTSANPVVEYSIYARMENVSIAVPTQLEEPENFGPTPAPTPPPARRLRQAMPDLHRLSSSDLVRGPVVLAGVLLYIFCVLPMVYIYHIVKRPKKGYVQQTTDSQPMSRRLEHLSKFFKDLGKVPVIGRYAAPAEVVTKAGATIARVFGYSKPTFRSNAQRYVPVANNNGCNIDGEGDFTSMGLYTGGEDTMIGSERFGVAPTGLDIQSMAGRKSIIGVFEFAATKAQTHTLFGFPVNPVYYDYEASNRCFYMTAAGQAISCFDYYNATVCYEVEVVRNNFQRGAFKISVDPATASISGTLTGESMSVIVNAAESDKTVIKVPYMGRKRFLRVRRPTKSLPTLKYIPGVFDQKSLNQFTDIGFLRAHVVNGVTNSQDVAAPIYLVVRCWLEDVQVFKPTSSEIASWLYTGPAPGITEEGSYTAQVGDEVMQSSHVLEAMDYNCATTCKLFGNEPILSLRPLLARECLTELITTDDETAKISLPMYPIWRGSNPTFFNQVNAQEGKNFHNSHTTLISVLRAQHVAMFGSMRYTVIPTIRRASAGLTTELLYSLNIGKGDNHWHYNDDVFSHSEGKTAPIDELHMGLSGSVYIDTRVNPYGKVSIPCYTDRKFLSSNGVPANHAAASLSSLDINILNPVNDGSASGSIQWTILASAGDDLTFAGYLYPTPFAKGKL